MVVPEDFEKTNPLVYSSEVVAIRRLHSFAAACHFAPYDKRGWCTSNPNSPRHFKAYGSKENGLFLLYVNPKVRPQAQFDINRYGSFGIKAPFNGAFDIWPLLEQDPKLGEFLESTRDGIRNKWRSITESRRKIEARSGGIVTPNYGISSYRDSDGMPYNLATIPPPNYDAIWDMDASPDFIGMDSSAGSSLGFTRAASQAFIDDAIRRGRRLGVSLMQSWPQMYSPEDYAGPPDGINYWSSSSPPVVVGEDESNWLRGSWLVSPPVSVVGDAHLSMGRAAIDSMRRNMQDAVDAMMLGLEAMDNARMALSPIPLDSPYNRPIEALIPDRSSEFYDVSKSWETPKAYHDRNKTPAKKRKQGKALAVLSRNFSNHKPINVNQLGPIELDSWGMLVTEKPTPTQAITLTQRVTDWIIEEKNGKS